MPEEVVLRAPNQNCRDCRLIPAALLNALSSCHSVHEASRIPARRESIMPPHFLESEVDAPSFSTGMQPERALLRLAHLRSRESSYPSLV